MGSRAVGDAVTWSRINIAGVLAVFDRTPLQLEIAAVLRSGNAASEKLGYALTQGTTQQRDRQSLRVQKIKEKEKSQNSTFAMDEI